MVVEAEIEPLEPELIAEAELEDEVEDVEEDWAVTSESTQSSKRKAEESFWRKDVCIMVDREQRFWYPNSKVLASRVWQKLFKRMWQCVSLMIPWLWRLWHPASSPSIMSMIVDDVHDTPNLYETWYILLLLHFRELQLTL